MAEGLAKKENLSESFNEKERGTQLTEVELISKIKEGTNPIYENVFFEKFHKLVCFELSKFFKSKEQIEDLTQEIFEKVFCAIREGGYKEKKGFKSWIVTITKHKAIDYIRSKKNKLETFGDLLDDQKRVDFLLKKLSDADLNPEDAFILKQSKERSNFLLKKLITQLPVQQQEVVNLHTYMGMSFKEIAKKTNIKLNTILSSYRYAKINLKKLAEKNGISEFDLK